MRPHFQAGVRWRENGNYMCTCVAIIYVPIAAVLVDTIGCDLSLVSWSVNSWK